jgi:glycosyltransferase involved in cell wall biosynthesis
LCWAISWRANDLRADWMKILRCIHSLDPAGGGPLESVTQSTLMLIERGHQVEVACLDAPDAAGVRAFPGKVHALGPSSGRYGYSPRFVPWIRIAQRRFDAVIVHGLWQFNSFGVWRALRGTTKPYFVFPHGMLDPWFKRSYPLKHLKKWLYWPWAEYRVLRDAATVLFTSEEERRLARESFWLYRCHEAVVNYGTATPQVDLSAARQKFFENFPQLRERPFFLFLGRLHEKKGCDLLIEAFKALRDSYQLVLAGPCLDQTYLQRLKALAGDSAVLFAGMLRGDQKWGAFSAAEAFVLPSHQENFGIAVAESLACGTPGLISNQINIWREIVADEAGFADEDTLAGTTRLLQRWLATPDEDRLRLRANARKCFAARFEIGGATDSLLSVLQQFVRQRAE